jgi:hypothetical protein
MGVTLKTVLDAGANAIPVAFETKFPKAPKLSPHLLKIDTLIPTGPAVWPAPPATGFPTFDISKLPNPPNIFGSPMPARAVPARAAVKTAPSGVENIPYNSQPPPRSARGDLTYLGAPQSARGTLTYLYSDDDY